MNTVSPVKTTALVCLSIAGASALNLVLFAVLSIAILSVAMTLFIIGIGAILYAYKIKKSVKASEWNYRA